MPFGTLGAWGSFLVPLLPIQKEESEKPPRRHRAAGGVAAEDAQEGPAGDGTSYAQESPVEFADGI